MGIAALCQQVCGKGSKEAGAERGQAERGQAERTPRISDKRRKAPGIAEALSD
jgi:hypothetical protein